MPMKVPALDMPMQSTGFYFRTIALSLRLDVKTTTANFGEMFTVVI